MHPAPPSIAPGPLHRHQYRSTVGASALTGDTTLMHGQSLAAPICLDRQFSKLPAGAVAIRVSAGIPILPSVFRLAQTPRRCIRSLPAAGQPGRYRLGHDAKSTYGVYWVAGPCS